MPKLRSLEDSLLFKSYEDPEKLETTCSDKRTTRVFRTLSEDELNVIKDNFYTVDREIETRQNLISLIKKKFNENIPPETLASQISFMIQESRRLTDSGIAKLLKDKQELSDIIDTGKRASDEEVFLVNNVTKMKTAYYDMSGYLIEIRDASEEEVNVFSKY